MGILSSLWTAIGPSYVASTTETKLSDEPKVRNTATTYAKQLPMIDDVWREYIVPQLDVGTLHSFVWSCWDARMLAKRTDLAYNLPMYGEPTCPTARFAEALAKRANRVVIDLDYAERTESLRAVRRSAEGCEGKWRKVGGGPWWRNSEPLPTESALVFSWEDDAWS